MHQAVNYLSQELYSKDVHFLMELVQNAEDNEYPDGVAPSLEFLVTSTDITGSGASSTLLIFNNEKGFSPSNIQSICGVGKSTKKGNRDKGYIGEKGIGFKSVFLISSQPHIFSNGYQIKFNEKPCPECNIGYIVPEWVESRPSLSDIKQIYGSTRVLPTTCIVLPLKDEKVTAVKQQLSSLHPEMLLFLGSTVSEIAISSEKNFEVRKNTHAESYTVFLSAQENESEAECGYHMWRQRFPVKAENRVDKRTEIDEWVITLAFPLKERLSRGKQLSPGVYAFLPTEMVTNFPFIIQADFLLASSREAILFDSPWNKGILECIPSAFMNAFVALVKSRTDAPAMTIPSMFHYLPVSPSLIPLLEPVRSGIKEKVLVEDIVPCESHTPQKMFCKPCEVVRLKPAFWDILVKARESGVDLKNLSTHGTYILSSHFDKSAYNSVLTFLDVKSVSHEWYAKCMEGSNLVSNVDEQLYLELLSFVADNWQNFSSTNLIAMPLLKYVDRNRGVSLWSISRASQWSDRLCIASDGKWMSWLISWNQEFPSSNRLFVPPNTQAALQGFSHKTKVAAWLQNHAKVEIVSVYSYGNIVVKSLNNDRRPAIAFSHFLYHSSNKNYMESYQLVDLCRTMPVIDNYGNAVTERQSILVPANGSKWVGLMGTNPWRNEKYIELSADYKSAGHFAENYTPADQILDFLKTKMQASDVPFIHPPNASFSTASSPLTVDNAILLLQWIRNLKSKGVQLPASFLACVKEGSWLKTSVGYKPPAESFMSSSEWGNLLQNGSSCVDIAMIDQQFYQYKMNAYREELKVIEVRFEFGEASAYIGRRLMSMAASNMLTRQHVYELLQLIRFLQQKVLSPSELLNSVKDGRWMKSILGYMSPSCCIIYDSDWAVASCISTQPFLDVGFYGESILDYKQELKFLGVQVGFENSEKTYKLIIDNFKFSSSSITSDATALILKYPEWECLVKVFNGVPVVDSGFYGSKISPYKEELKKTGLIAGFDQASKAIANIFKHKWLPLEAILFDEDWQSLSPIASLPIINDGDSNGGLGKEMHGYKAELKDLGVTTEVKAHGARPTVTCLNICDNPVDIPAARFVINGLNIPADPASISVATMLSLLGCVKSWLACAATFPKEFMEEITSCKWLKTTFGYQSLDGCILFDPKQSSMCVTDGPFIDESFYGSDIASFKGALAAIGVTVDVRCGHGLVAQHLRSHKETATISRIYLYLKECSWGPEKNKEGSDWIWIPNEKGGGEWVSPLSCVLHDQNNLFSQQLHVLDRYYDDRKLLDFFSSVFGVGYDPGAEDHCKLWSAWESSGGEISVTNCSAFWQFIARNWSKSMEKLISGCVKVPACTDGKIILSRKEDVFIPDDLLLKGLFDKLPRQSIFIWYPPSVSRARLNNVYGGIGVQAVSKAAEKSDSFVVLGQDGSCKTVAGQREVISVGLLQIVLAFLADPALDIASKERHTMVSCLLNVSVLETKEPITVGYRVKLSSGEAVDVEASRMIRWERENSKLYVQRGDGAGAGAAAGYKEKIEFATNFADEIARGLLFETPDRIPSLAELVKVGSLVDFQDDAVKYLLKSKNLQLFPEDEAFLNAASLGCSKKH
nr:uncharacterized protein LOC109784830 [Aegilops tauschii subsp. strangulata]